jgi:FkbM family methyltransferase
MLYNLKDITNQLNCSIRGVIHVGGFVGEELHGYRELGLTNTILFEPQQKLYEIIQSKCQDDEQVFNVALGSEACEKEMFISDRHGGIEAGAGASSSLLKPKIHLTEHPEVTFPTTTTVQVHRLDEFLQSENLRAINYNMLNIDVQGYELEVLKGADSILGCIKLMILEINIAEVYEGCPLVEELDEFLRGHHFERVYTYWQSTSWGDAVYVKH